MKTKKTAILCVMLALTIFLSSMLFSCDKKTGAYRLAEYLLNPVNPYEVCGFSSELNIKIKDNNNGAIPDELNFKIDGQFYEIQAIINITLEDFKTTAYKYKNLLYVELNDLSKIILDLLISTGFVDKPVKDLFESMTDYENGTVLCFDLTDFDLSWFDRYIDDTDKKFDITSTYKVYSLSEYYDLYGAPDWFGLSVYDEKTSLKFSDIKTKIQRELLKLPDYRYKELYIVMETAENDNNYINILATRENGERKILDKVKIDCDLSQVHENPETIYSGNILPMRYLLELLGETVGWDDEIKQAYIVKNGKNIYFAGDILNARTYISLLQIMAGTDYNILVIDIDEFIEIKISRK